MITRYRFGPPRFASFFYPVEANNNERRRLTARRTLVRFAFTVALRVLSRAITQLPAITDAL